MLKVPIPKANFALVKAVLQTAPEELAVKVQYWQHQSKWSSSHHPTPTASLGLAGKNVLLMVASPGFLEKTTLGSYRT